MPRRAGSAFSFLGGFGERYNSAIDSTATGRHRSAPAWSPAAAQLAVQVFAGLNLVVSGRHRSGRTARLGRLLTCRTSLHTFFARLAVCGSPSAARLAKRIFEHHVTAALAPPLTLVVCAVATVLPAVAIVSATIAVSTAVANAL
ncbi:hypothetical protein OAO87_01840, partial [bacterium]|nr:hypothetical protein [bacterium]